MISPGPAQELNGDHRENAVSVFLIGDQLDEWQKGRNDINGAISRENAV